MIMQHSTQPQTASGFDPADHRCNWTHDQVAALFTMPFADLILLAQTVLRRWFRANEVQMSTLLSIKTGGCPEDCGYCSQSSHHRTSVNASKLMHLDTVLAEARSAKARGATRYCMGAAWRSPKDRDLDLVCAMIKSVRALGMETCVTLGMLSNEQARRLRDAGLHYYNHNIDTSEKYYDKVVSTRSYQDRLETLDRVRSAGINVCCGGIIGMGESEADRIEMLMTLANLSEPPESVPINALVRIEGTPLGDTPAVEWVDFVRTIAVARVMMPRSMVRLSAGRQGMSEELQALCFLAGANSIFIGDRLLTTENPKEDKDLRLFTKLGIEPMPAQSSPPDAEKRRDEMLKKAGGQKE